jgi:homoserine acetyltransferase
LSRPAHVSASPLRPSRKRSRTEWFLAGSGELAPKAVVPKDNEPQTFELGNFHLEGKQVITAAKLVYTTFGRLNDDKSNAILIGSPYGDDHDAHKFLIGPGMDLDPAVDFIISTDQLGNGVSSSPSNTPAPLHGDDFPQVVIRDDVEAIYRLVTEKFGIKRLKAVVGISARDWSGDGWGIRLLHGGPLRDLFVRMMVCCSTAGTLRA